VAHHVQKKATRKHNAYRPKKSRASDIFRKPPSYPAMPDIPEWTKLDGLTGVSKTAVSIEITPEDTAATLAAKVTGAGAPAPDEFTYAGMPLSGSLGDAGLAAATTVEAQVVAKE
jgi:hypothetical protein